MPPTKQELSLLINPLVPESVQHNNRVRTPSPSPATAVNRNLDLKGTHHLTEGY